MFLEKKLDIRKVVFYTSESCNLNCSYCQIAAQARNYKHDASKAKEALKSGEYLSNYKKAFSRLGADPQRVESIDIWGQEPTLTLDEFTSQIPAIFNLFPNWKETFFSTNGVAYSERIFDLIKAIDENTRKPFSVKMQFSCDGTAATKKYRNIDASVIVENAKKLLTLLNDYTLKNTSVEINLHNVLSRALMADLMSVSDEEFIAYYKDLDDIAQDLFSLSKNPKVQMAPTFSSGIENPVDSSTEEGIRVYEFYKRSKQLCPPSIFKGPCPIVYEGLVVQHSSFLARKLRNFNQECNINAALDSLLNPYLDPEMIKRFTRDTFCKANYDFQLKMKHDGTLLYCQNALYSLDKDKILGSNLQAYARRAYASSSHNFLNILTCSDEELHTHFFEQRILNDTSFPFLFMETVNLMIHLANCYQIHESYRTDLNKLYRHSLLLASLSTCLDNNLIETGTQFGRTANYCRLLANGLLDIIEQDIYRIVKGENNRC